MDPFDVAVLGLGPAGSAATILFADAGLKVAAIEREASVYPLPRAVALDGEIVRGFQRVGRAEELAALLQATRPGERAGFANSRREWLFGNEFRDFGVNGWQPMSMFDQPEVETWLRATACAHPNVTPFIGHEMQTFTDDSGPVRIRTASAGTEDMIIPTRYLVACDGAGSPTRRALGVDWKDLGYDHDWLVVDVVTRPGHTLGLDTLQVCDPDRITTYVATKDPYRRWEFKLNPGETAAEMLDHETIYRLIEPWTPRDTVEIRRAAVYQFHAAIADRWRTGRVLLAGDAAHQTPPFLGQGMNAGMRDVINLSWKLPLVIEGTCDDALLDSYQAERGAHAEDLVAWAVAVGRLMEHLAAVEAAERAGREPPVTSPEQRASGYGQGREAPPLRDGIVVLEQVSDTGSTGYLFRQPVVRDLSGREFRLDEQLGRGFAVVARTAADLDLDEDAASLIEGLGIALVSLDDLTPVRGEFDLIFATAAAVVVRPDRYVFGHTSESMTLSELLRDLTRKLVLTG